MQVVRAVRWPIPVSLRNMRLLTGSILLVYVFTHLLNHALGLIGLDAAESGLEVAKAVWHGAIGTVLLYGAAGIHVLLALRTIYLRQHWRLPLIEYVRLAAGFGFPLLLIGHVVATRLAYSLHDVQPHYSAVVAGLTLSGNEGWQLALLAPGWLHGCLGLWLTLTRFHPSRIVVGTLIALMIVVPLLAGAGFLRMRSEVIARGLTQVTTVQDPVRRASLETWRRIILGSYCLLVAGAFAAGPVRRALVGARQH